jgi:hypothetical protein
MKIRYIARDEKTFDVKEDCELYESYLDKLANGWVLKSATVSGVKWFMIEDVADLYLYDHKDDNELKRSSKTLYDFFVKPIPKDKFPLYLMDSSLVTSTYKIDELNKRKIAIESELEDIHSQIKHLESIGSHFKQEEVGEVETDTEPVTKFEPLPIVS